jgi:hypothetical protein
MDDGYMSDGQGKKYMLKSISMNNLIILKLDWLCGIVWCVILGEEERGGCLFCICLLGFTFV